MLQKLMLAVTMTFALNLLLGIRPPANTQTDLSDRVDIALLKARTINNAPAIASWKESLSNSQVVETEH